MSARKPPKIDSRTARTRLAPRSEPYWRAIAPGESLGYRRGKAGGAWVAKRVADGARRQVALGPADDGREADGVGAFSYAQALKRAQEWFGAEARREAGVETGGRPCDVDAAVDDYLDWFRANRKSLAETEAAIDRHIRPALGRVRLEKLTRRKIERWLNALAETPRRNRAGRASAVEMDEEAQRRRKSTANRVLTILKAALNRAFSEGRVNSDLAWRSVKPFRGVDAARARWLTDEEARRLVNACEPSFRPLVVAALLSGARYGELARLRVSDFIRAAGALEIREAKSGQPRVVYLTDEGMAHFEALCAGRRPEALVFTRTPDGGAWGKSHQQRPLLEACRGAMIEPAVGFHVLRHTYASRAVMRGAPLPVVAAQLGHSDTRMVEKHYAHL
ncbi:MAG: tyrosine-type recombinase/integrase, partial [Pseudomonadota bacterium]